MHCSTRDMAHTAHIVNMRHTAPLSAHMCISLCTHGHTLNKYAQVGLVGGNMATHMKTLGCRGVVCDGPARDFDELRHIPLTITTRSFFMLEH